MGGPGADPAPPGPGRADPPRLSDAAGPTLRLVHLAAPGPSLVEAPPDGAPLMIVAGPVGAVLPEGAGRPGGRILHLSYLPPQPSAFRVLADCARILPRIDDAVGAGLSYVLAGHDASLPDPDPGPGDAVAWRAGPDGTVRAFRLSAAAMGDPLLAPATEALADAPLTDERRFAFLAATLAGG